MAQTLGPYTLGEPLGTLPFGELIEATHAARREPLALLILPDALTSDHRLRGLLRLEIARAGGLRHPAIARPVEVGEHDGRLYVVYERPAGEPLGRWIDGAPDLTAETVVTMVRQLADGLDTAHGRRLAHGAIGPSAILTRTGESAALVGIGVLAALDEAGLSDACRPKLDPALAAPEQQSGRLADPSADSFALGRLARMLLAATTDGPNGQIPHGIQAALDRQDSDQPSERFRTCGELAAALAGTLASQSSVPVQLDPPSLPTDGRTVAVQPAQPSAPSQRDAAPPPPDVAPNTASPVRDTAPRSPTKKRPAPDRPWRQDGNHRVTTVEATPAMSAAIDTAFSAAVLRLVAVGAGPLFLLVIALLMREILPLVPAIAGIVVLRMPSATTRAIRLWRARADPSIVQTLGPMRATEHPGIGYATWFKAHRLYVGDLAALYIDQAAFDEIAHVGAPLTALPANEEEVHKVDYTFELAALATYSSTGEFLLELRHPNGDLICADAAYAGEDSDE